MTFERFLHTHLATVDHLRAILLLHEDPQRLWDPLELSTALRIPPPVAIEVLARLEAGGLVASFGNSPRFRCQPASAEAVEFLEQIIAMDREKPVTLLNLIYSRATDLQAFPEAFKFRKGGGA